MRSMAEENADHGISQNQGSGTIPALADEELMGEDDEFDDLYSDVNVGENFFQAHHPQLPANVGGNGNGNGGLQAQRSDTAEPRMPTGGPSGTNVPGGSAEEKYQNNEGNTAAKGPEMRFNIYPQGSSAGAKSISNDASVMKMVSQGSTSVVLNTSDVPKSVSGPESVQNSYGATPQGPQQIPANQMSDNPNVNHTMVNKSPMWPQVENGNAMLFVGELHWWTTDAELESVLLQYGRVKEIKFFDERASGKSKGYCQVEFYDAAAAAACKEGMNGHVFNGRACVVAFASPETLKQMGANFTGRNQVQNQGQQRRNLNDGMGRNNNVNMQSGDGGRNYGRGGFGRGGQGMANRGGPWGGGPMQGRGLNNMGGNMAAIGNGLGAGPFGPGLAGPAFGGPAAGMMHPHGMMNAAGFDPTFMGRGASYGGFPGLGFPGMPPSFPGANAVGMLGVAPHVNPAFFGRGMGANGMGMMGSAGMDGHHAGMWNDTSGYGGEDGGSEYGYEDENQDKDGKSNAPASREKERASERDWSENNDRRHRDEREHKGHRYHEEKDGYRDYRQRERDSGFDDDWGKGQSSSRSRSKSRMTENDYRSRSRDADNGKRRRAD